MSLWSRNSWIQLFKSVLSKNFLNLRIDLGETLFFAAALSDLRYQRAAVIRFHVFACHPTLRPQTQVDEPHHLKLLCYFAPQHRLICAITGQQPLPVFVSLAFRIARSNLPELLRYVFFFRCRDVLIAHLQTQQLLVNQPVEHGAPLLIRIRRHGPALLQGLERDRMFPIALQNRHILYRSHEAVHKFPRETFAGRECQPSYQDEFDKRSHQNVWPMLKNTLTRCVLSFLFVSRIG